MCVYTEEDRLRALSDKNSLLSQLSNSVYPAELTFFEIKDCWEHIKDHVESLRVMTGMDWRTEDVYAKCLYQEAFCFVCQDGFIICQRRTNSNTKKVELFVWICVSWSATDVIEKHYPEIVAIAKSELAANIIFASNRQGWHKIAKARGWIEKTEYIIGVE